MPRTYDTRSCSSRERLEFWTAAVCEQIVPVQIDPRGTEQLQKTAMRSTSLGALQVREVIGGTHVYVRDDGDIRRGDPETLQVGLQVAGNSTLVQDGRAAVLGAGDLVLYDSSRPFTLAMDARFHWQVFLLPKDKLRRSDREISRLTAVTINGAGGIAGLVTRFLRDLATASATLEQESTAAALCDNAADLVATLVRAELRQSWKVADPQKRVLDAAEAFIADHLHDPHLDPERVAHAVNVSVRRLHQLFSATGRTISDHIREQRLAAVRRDLGDPALAGLSLGRVGARHGFVNPSLFSRQFRLAHGCTPSQYRQRLLPIG